MNIDPLKQFKILEIANLEFLDGYSIPFTNSSLMMSIIFIVIFFFFQLALRKNQLIPSYLQVSAEIIFKIVDDSLSGIDAKVKNFFFQ